eukprot:g16149.t1
MFYFSQNKVMLTTNCWWYRLRYAWAYLLSVNFPRLQDMSSEKTSNVQISSKCTEMTLSSSLSSVDVKLNR